MSHLITLHRGQIPIEVAGLHLVPGKAVPVDEVPAEVLALRPRVRMTITPVRGLQAAPGDGPERDGAPDLGGGDGGADEPVEPPRKGRQRQA